MANRVGIHLPTWPEDGTAASVGRTGRPVSVEGQQVFDSVAAGAVLGADTRSPRCCKPKKKTLVAGAVQLCTSEGQPAGAAPLCMWAGAAHGDMTAVVVVPLSGRIGAGVVGRPSRVAPCCSSGVGPRPGRIRVAWMA